MNADEAEFQRLIHEGPGVPECWQAAPRRHRRRPEPRAIDWFLAGLLTLAVLWCYATTTPAAKKAAAQAAAAQ